MRQRRIIGPGFPYLVTPVGGAAPPAGPAVQNIGTFLNSGAGVTTVTYTGLTVSAGLTNSALLAFILNNSGTTSVDFGTGATATWSGTGMALRASILGGGNTSGAIWGLRAPASGNNNLVFSWSGATQVTVCAISLSGINQASDNAAFAHSATANPTGATSASITLTTTSGNICVALYENPWDFSVVRTGTPIFTNASLNFAVGASYIAATSSSQTMTETASSAGDHVILGTDSSA